MNRRQALAGLSSAVLLSGCARRGTPSRSPAPSRPPSAEVTAADFAWFERSEPRLAQCFTLTWLAGLVPERVVRRIDGRPVGYYGWADLPAAPDDGVIVAVTQAAGWALMVETYTRYGVADAVAELSKDTRLVADFRNVELDGRFLLAENGRTLVEFDPYTAYARTGARPDLLVDQMTAVGLKVTGPDLSVPSPPEIPETEAAFALTERLVTVPFTEDLLSSSKYLAAVVPDPYTSRPS
ncbi:DUF6461 domain-containing protein [Actinoplanes palleronii]|uniref:Lipoprotein n=1 Tax=Actinoplanes palleronii TaxID=113570 RepID=A0ABQ4BMP4_9ACTN|nr:DUF6461 domain-containing protein [Actinoplanes palleronii]GIE71957.1 hypothetical protein Apa02nite_080650 [Actinoplanes palleronii]